jgi:transcription antitermination factor NusG
MQLNNLVPLTASHPPLLPPWFAVRVRAKSEVLVGALLQSKGYEAFTPTYREQRTYSDRIRRIDAALFPGYVFCRFPPHEMLPIVSTPAVQKILTTGGVPAPITDAEIETVRRTAQAGGARPHPWLSIGQKVRIADGALSGIEGFLIAVKGHQRLVISADLLQRAISVELNDYRVVPV